MIDIASLEIATPTTAPPGSLLIECAKSPRFPVLLAVGGGGARNTLIIGDGKLGFEVVDMSRAHGLFLRVGPARFMVDPASAVSGFDHSPDPGTLFRTPAGTGMLARVDGAEHGVLLDGTLTQVDYALFAGFRRWRIELDGSGEEPHVLYAHGGRDPGQEV
jgi:hypothetical protein